MVSLRPSSRVYTARSKSVKPYSLSKPAFAGSAAAGSLLASKDFVICHPPKSWGSMAVVRGAAYKAAGKAHQSRNKAVSNRGNLMKKTGLPLVIRVPSAGESFQRQPAPIIRTNLPSHKDRERLKSVVADRSDGGPARIDDEDHSLVCHGGRLGLRILEPDRGGTEPIRAGHLCLLQVR